MPPKRKSLPTEADDKARKAKMVKKMEPPKTWKETEYSAKLESEYKEPIKYDEYMEGGIPDSLLEGLGFSESEVPQDAVAGADDDDETTGADPDLGSGAEPLRGFDPSVLAAQGLTEAMSSYVVDQINAMAKSGLISATLPQQIVDLTLAASNRAMVTAPSQVSAAQARKPVTTSTSPLRMSRRLSARNSNPTDNTVTVDSSKSTSRLYTPTPVVRPTPPRVVSQFATGTRPPPVSLPVQPPRQPLPRNTRVYNTAPRTITKGNIVYERMPTGEVIASLIKKPTPDVSGRPNQTGDSTARGSLTASYRGVPASSASPITFEDCPINEYNVGEVLEKSIKATQSMRMLLTSLRDDLRRIGAGSAMVTEEQVRKRQEVADKLTKAYATYKRSIEDIETPQAPENTRSATATSAATHRTDKPTTDMARPVMLVKHGIPMVTGASEHGNTRRGASATVTTPAVGRTQDRGEVIELSESDDDNEHNGPTSRNSGEGSHRREGSSRAASNSVGRQKSDGIRSAEVGKPNKEQSSQKDGQSGEASETKTGKIDSTDSKRKECNGVGGSASEKK